MKETLILGNHPQTFVIAPHVLRLLSEENTVVLTVPVIAAILQAIPGKNYEALTITRKNRSSSRINDILLRTLGALHAKTSRDDRTENPIETAGDMLAEGRNLLLFPTGTVQRDVTKPEPWRSGAGRIVRHAYPKNTAISVAFLRIFDRKNAELSEPLPVQNLESIQLNTGNEHVDGIEVTRELWRLYHTYFGLLDS